MVVSDSENEDDMQQKILQNAVYCLFCKKFLVSTSVHDYVECGHKMVDGGHDYIRRSPCEEEDDFSLYENSCFEEVCANLLILHPPKNKCENYVLMKSLSYSQLRELTDLTQTQTKVAEFLLLNLSYCSNLSCYQIALYNQMHCENCEQKLQNLYS